MRVCFKSPHKHSVPQILDTYERLKLDKTKLAMADKFDGFQHVSISTRAAIVGLYWGNAVALAQTLTADLIKSVFIRHRRYSHILFLTL